MTSFSRRYFVIWRFMRPSIDENFWLLSRGKAKAILGRKVILSRRRKIRVTKTIIASEKIEMTLLEKLPSQLVARPYQSTLT